MITLALTLLALPQLTPEQTQLVNALIQVESNGKDDAVGDNGNAIGCLQIWKIYHTDAIERSNIGGVYRDCFKRKYAIRVFDAYMRRYAREAWTGTLDAEKVARIHNGGPKGYKKEATIKYWKKVEILLDAKRPRLYNIGIMENTSYYDSSYSPNEACEACDVPACSNCADTGVIEKGYDVRSTVFCECDAGDETFCAWADAEGAMAHECDDYDSDYGATADYWQNDAGEWSCG